MVKILTFGEIIWDIYGSDEVLGGAGLNFAAHAGKCGAESAILSAVGNDKLGERAVAEISRLGVDTRFLLKNNYETGKCLVTLDGRGIPSYELLTNTAYDFIKIGEQEFSEIKNADFDALYFGSLIQRSGESRATLRKLLTEVSFKDVICDVNLRKNCYDRESVLFCLENATILKISDEEEPLLREMKLYSAEDSTPEKITVAIAKKYKNIGCILFTMGERGAYVYESREKRGFYSSPKSAKVISSVGAGDSFTAAFVTSYLSGNSDESSAELAAALAAFVVSRKEAIPEYRITNGEITAKT